MTRNDLAALAATKKMIPDAPIRAQRSVEIEAPSAAVWETLTAVSYWPRWHSYLKNAKLYGPFAAGTRLTYGGLFKHDLHIAFVEDQQRVMIYGTLMGYTAITRWDIDPLGPARTRVTFSEASAGFLIGSLYSDHKLGIHLQNWLNKLKLHVERS